jgi:serine/threonine-protein kinase
MWTPEFTGLSLQSRLDIFDSILDFHAHMAEKEYCALDLYEDHILWDVRNEKVVICDIDFYSKAWYEGMSGIWNTDCEWYPPEQFIDGAAIDEISCVYMMGAAAFALFGDGRDRSMEKWKISEDAFNVAKRAVSCERGARQQSIVQLIAEWEAAFPFSLRNSLPSSFKYSLRFSRVI